MFFYKKKIRIKKSCVLIKNIELKRMKSNVKSKFMKIKFILFKK